MFQTSFVQIFAKPLPQTTMCVWVLTQGKHKRTHLGGPKFKQNETEENSEEKCLSSYALSIHRFKRYKAEKSDGGGGR